MRFQISGRPKVALVVAAGAALVGASVASLASQPAAAAPISMNLTYSCKYPQIGTKDLKLKIALDFPKRVPAGTRIPPTALRAVTSVDAETTDGLLAVRAARIDGRLATATAALDIPGLDLKEAIARVGIPKTTVPPVGAFDLEAPGQFIQLTPAQPGTGRIWVKDLKLDLQLKKADGSDTSLGENITVLCTQKPDQDNLMAEFEITKDADTKAPSKPGTPQVTSKSAKTVGLSWGRSSDDYDVYAYDVYDGDGTTPVATSVGGSQTSVTVANLAPGTPHTFRVKARDLSGNASEASAPVQVTTDPDAPDTQAPTAPGKPTVTGLLKDSAVLAWPASTDNVKVESYEIYANDKLAGSTATNLPPDKPFGWATGLTPLQTYALTVRAKDAAGNRSAPSPAVSVTMPKGPPAGCGDLKGDADWIEACAYMAGYANVNKLDSAVELNGAVKGEPPVLTNVAYYATETKAKAKFRFVGPLRSSTTALTFKFMPTVATMELTQVGDGVMEGEDTPDGFKGTATATMAVRLLDATANGTVLNLGPHCRSTKPTTIALKTGPNYKSIKDGGILEGVMTIPTFTGCGVGEDLDPLLNGSISGSGNLVRIMQGPVCQTSSAECKPVDPRTAR